jgi:hypothetical protein
MILRSRGSFIPPQGHMPRNDKLNAEELQALQKYFDLLIEK